MDTPDILITILQFTGYEYAILARVSKSFHAAYCFGKPLRKRTWTSAFLLEPFSLFQWLYEEYPDVPITAETFARAARGADYEHALPWLRERSTEWDKDTFDAVVEKGNLPMVQWLFENGCPWDAWSWRKASRDGHLHILQWAFCQQGQSAIQNALREYQTVLPAATRGYLPLVLWFYQIGTPFNTAVSSTAARFGHWAIVFWLLLNDCPFVLEDLLVQAIVQGRVQLLQWFLRTFPPLPLDSPAVLNAAAQFSAPDNVAYLMDMGFAFDAQQLLHRAASAGNEPVVFWLLEEHPCRLDEHIFAAAASCGHLMLMKWMQGRQCPLAPEAMSILAKTGKIEPIQWMYEFVGMPLTADMFRVAAAEGHLNLLQWLHARNCPYDERALQGAVLRRQRAVVDWCKNVLNK